MDERNEPIRRGVVPVAGGAQSVALGADSVAYLVEQLQMSRWLLELIKDRGLADLDQAMVQRRIDALALAVAQLVDGAAQMGVALELAPEVELALSGSKPS